MGRRNTTVVNNRRRWAGGSPVRYAGQVWDGETGPLSYIARHASAGLERIVSLDPFRTADGPHLYAYVGNDPLNLADPSSLVAETAANVASEVQSMVARY